MKKGIKLIAGILLACTTLAGCGDGGVNSADILHNDIVYVRSDYPNYNINLLEDHKTYIGDYLETYNYGYQIPWEVFTLNSEENILFSAHAIWIKPGYEFPDEYGEEFSKADYVISEGILDTYTEEVFPLTTFEAGVTLEDIIEDTPTELAEYTEHADVRLYYTHHADIVLGLTLCSAEGVFYLNVRADVTGAAVLYKIKPEYATILSAQIHQN